MRSFLVKQNASIVLAVGLALLCVGPSSIASAESAPAAALAPATEPACAPGTGEATARQVQTRYDGIRDLRANFSQESQSASFAGAAFMDSDPKTGQVVFAKPGKMRWTYVAPEPSVVVSDGSTLWIYDVEGGTATRLAVTAGYLSGAALQFLLGDGNLVEEFEIAAVVCSDQRVTLDLTPRLDSGYERLGLVADAKTGDIEETLVVDLFGNRTEIRFDEMETNQNPQPSVFQFDVPEGVELIDYEASPSG
jgi:outer membrane lipoprotein carrier protein